MKTYEWLSPRLTRLQAKLADECRLKIFPLEHGRDVAHRFEDLRTGEVGKGFKGVVLVSIDGIRRVGPVCRPPKGV